MSLTDVPFEKRLRNIVRNHQRMNHGAVHAIRSDGLIVARPRVYNPKFPLRGLVMLITAAVLFKAYIYASLGSATYSGRIDVLAQGSLFEKAGAWIMQPDAVTVAAAQVMTAIGL